VLNFLCFMKTTVIKIGSGVILTGRNKLDEFRIAHIAEQVAVLRKKGIRVVLIMSGAVACGANYIQLLNGDIKLRKLAAGIGQAYLTSIVRKYFSAKNLTVAQILLTQENLNSPDNMPLKETLEYYLEIGVVPIINENDVVELNGFGGNDFLAAKIADLLGAERMVMLSTMEESGYGVGGGTVKKRVVAELNEKGIKTSIVDGKEKNIIINNIL